MTELLTKKDLLPVLRRIVDEHPDQVNPRNADGYCLYTSATDPDHHCLVGQLAVEMGWPMPDATFVASAARAGEHLGWPVHPRALAWLDGVQGAADGGLFSDGRPWGSEVVKARLR